LGGRDIAQEGGEILPRVLPKLSAKFWEAFVVSSKFHQDWIRQTWWSTGQDIGLVTISLWVEILPMVISLLPSIKCLIWLS